MSENQNKEANAPQAAVPPKKVAVYICNRCGTSWGENENRTMCPECGEEDYEVMMF